MTDTTLDTDILRQWIGRSEDRVDALDPRQIELSASILPTYDDFLGPFRHLFYFPDARPLAELGRDGHPKRGGFLPPVGLPRRMWAGGELTFNGPLRIGDGVRRTDVVDDVTLKDGRSGPLCFVTTRASFAVNHRTKLVEERRLVYREDPRPDAPTPEPPRVPETPSFSRTISPSATLLFRYSALTFNGHRIHYDLDYCRQVEGYPHLVVHGPLIATLLADLALERRSGMGLRRFSYRAAAPLFADADFTLEGRDQGRHALALWARGADGRVAMTATAAFG